MENTQLFNPEIVKVIDNTFYDSTFPKTPALLISRDAEIDLITKTLEKYPVIFLEGEQGVGKTICLAQFAQLNRFNTISHFITSTYNFSYNPSCLRDNIFKQLYFYSKGIEFTEENVIDDTYFATINIPLLKKIRKDNKPLYFIFDCMADIPTPDLDALKLFLYQLPFGKAKFIFSTPLESKLLQTILPLNISFKYIPLAKFSYTQTKEYFIEYTATEAQFQELHKICNKGLPSKLSIVKRICSEKGTISEFLESDITDETDLFALDWQKANSNDEIQQLILALVAFDDSQIELSKISEILHIEIPSIIEKVLGLTFILVENNYINYFSESHKLFAQKQLGFLKDKILTLLIKHYEDNPDSVYRTLNLPNLYEKAKRWKDITKLLSVEAFIQYLEKYQSLASIKRQFDFGLSASKNIIEVDDILPEHFRFALHKTSIKEFEKYEMWENEVEARLCLGEYDKALEIANSAFLKEDKLKLFAVLAKQRNEQKLGVDPYVIEQIKDLYNQIDFSLNMEKGFEIAGILIYSCFDISIDLIEKLTEKSSGKYSLDIALAQLSLYVATSSQRNKSSSVNIDLINSRIKNDDLKNLASGIKYISAEYSISEIIEHTEKSKDTGRKILLLKGWILNNKDNPEVAKAIEYTLNEIIKSSSDEVPNATILSEIAIPLPILKDFEAVDNLIKLFDSQKNLINTPTKDYVKLQLLIAEALNSYDEGRAKDRFFEIYYLIDDEIRDFSIKTDCLTLMWLKLLEIDKDHSIEISLSSKVTFESQIKANIEKLLNETALHFRMVDYIIKTIIGENPKFLYPIIPQLNTQERRDEAYRISTLHYIYVTEFKKIDFDVVNHFYQSLINIEFREQIIIELLLKYSKEKELSIPYILNLLKYKEDIVKFTNIENKCFAIITLLNIVRYDSDKYRTLIQGLLGELEKAWSVIDLQYRKIEIGFLIAKDLGDFNKDEALIYLNKASKLKQDESLSSESIVKAYNLSVKLCIRSFGGMLRIHDDINPFLNKLFEIIDYMQSSGEKLKLLNEIALNLFSNKRIDEFNKVTRDRIIPLLSNIDNQDKSYKDSILTSLATTLFLNNQTTFFEIIKALSSESRDYSLKSTCDFIFTKLIYDEPIEDNQNGYAIDYEEYVNICILINEITNDYFIYSLISKVVISIRENRDRRLSLEQKNDIIRRLKEIVDSRLPNLRIGVNHQGYKIISEAAILSLENQHNNKNKWEELTSKARLISNLSDKALVLSSIADITENKKIKNDLLDESFKLIESIPANYEKSYRFEEILEKYWQKSDKSLFNKYWGIAFNTIIKDKEGNFNDIKNLVDLAYEHSPKLAETAITLLDNDPARMKLKKPLEKRIKNNEKVKGASSDFKLLEELNPEQFSTVFQQNLAGLNAGKYNIKDIKETIQVLDKISSLSLSDSYDAICYFIQNAILKSKHKLSNQDLLNGIFNATYLNAKLVATLAADNVVKMKRMFTYTSSQVISSNPIIRYGDKEKAIEYIRNWITDNVSNSLIIIDPYFTENELEYIKIVSEVNPLITITILTSRLSGNNQHGNNKDKYVKEWQNISSSLPPDTNIIVVYENITNACPFHDRWWLADDMNSGFTVPSVNGLGIRDSQINEMDEFALINVQQLVNDYIYKRERRIRGFNLRYDYFELCFD